MERRAYPRQPIDHLTVLRLRDETAIAARIVDGSLRGLRVEIDRTLPIGTPVRMALHEETVMGRVCYCISSESGENLVGLELENTLENIDDLSKLSRALEADGADGVVERAKEALPEGLGERG